MADEDLALISVSRYFDDASGTEAGKLHKSEDDDEMRQITLTLALAAMASLTVTSAYAYSDKVKKACAGDYQNYCNQYLPDSTELRRCFESNRKGLSQYCISALVDAGEVPSKYLKK